jgi:RNA polymerase sigma factor (sigma-70 family)
MNEDAELLSRYAAEQSEAAITELIQRHVDLVHSAALRLAGGDAHRAQDITQQVFTELARQARRLSKHPALVGWLYTTTRRIALHTHRTEQRRKVREQEAHAMTELLRETDPPADWDHLSPLLEDAMHHLAEKDRLAVLLRYFQNKPLKEVGAVLGLNENAARMRVDRALDKLRGVLTQRGVTLSAAGLGAALVGNAVQAAPAGVVTALSAASFLTAAASGTASLMTLTTLKVGLVSATVAAAAMAAPLVIQHHAQTRLRAENETLRQQVAQLTPSSTESTTASPADSASSSPALSSEQFNELLRLRGEVTRLRQDSQELARLKAGGLSAAGDPLTAEMNSWLAKVNELRQKLDQRPDLKIPELQFLTPRDWLNVALNARPETDAGARLAFSRLRAAAKQAFAPALRRALNSYVQASGGQLPAEVSQLKAYFDPPVDDVLLDHYQLVRSGKASEVPSAEPAILVEKVPVDAEFDSTLCVGLNGSSLSGEGGGDGFGFGNSFSSGSRFGGGTNGSDAGGGGGSFGSIRFGSGSSSTNLTPTPR